MNEFFESTKKRMPHFFSGVDILEYTPHSISKKLLSLFEDSRYYVLDPGRTNLSYIDDGTFRVVISVDYFQHTPDYLEHLKRMHRVSSKFVMFSCAAAGNSNYKTERYYKNLTMSDFYNALDLDSMFDSYKFDVSYSLSELYFWGVKRDGV